MNVEQVGSAGSVSKWRMADSKIQELQSRLSHPELKRLAHHGLPCQAASRELAQK